MKDNLSNQNLIQLSENELNDINGGSLILIAACYVAGFAAGAAIAYFS